MKVSNLLPVYSESCKMTLTQFAKSRSKILWLETSVDKIMTTLSDV